MFPKTYLQSFAANVVKHSGICKATVEAVLPHVFDEIRRQLTEGTLCVPIESFGTFAVIQIPERTRHYTYKGLDEYRTLPPVLKIKFRPTRNFQREVDAQRFDPTRRSFTRHPDDRAIQKRKHMKYNKRSTVYLAYTPGTTSYHSRVVRAYEKIEKPTKPTKSTPQDVTLSAETLTTFSQES